MCLRASDRIHMQVPFREKFASEKDPLARSILKANFEIEILYDDITDRDHKDAPGQLDLYTAGVLSDLMNMRQVHTSSSGGHLRRSNDSGICSVWAPWA